VVLGMQGQLPGADIQFHFMPDGADEVRFLQNLINEAVRAENPEGFVLVRSTYEAQKLLSESGLPSVIFGTPYPSIDLSWVDRDRKRSEQLLAEYLLDRGCLKIGLLWRQRILPSDPEGLDAVTQVLAQHNRPATALHVRCLPPERAVVQAAVRQMVGRDPGPWGLICRSRPLAEHAASVKGKNLTVVISDVYPKPTESLRFTHVRPAADPKAIGIEIAQRLLTACRTGRRSSKSLAVERVEAGPA